MELKPGYKQTDVGVVPEDWDVRSLEGIAEIVHGFGFQSRYFRDTGSYRLTTPGHFFEEGGFRDLGGKQKFYDGPLPHGCLLEKGDLLVAMTEQADGLLGSAAFVPIGGTFLHNQRLGKIRVLSPTLSDKFLYRVLNSPLYRSRVRETAAGTKVKHTSPARLLEIAVPLPPTRVEQDAIAETLSDADALIDFLDQLIAKKRDLKQAVLQQLLTGRTRLPGFDGKWELKRIADIALPSSERNTSGESLPVLTCSKHFGFMDSLAFFKNQVFSKDLSTYRVIRRDDIGYPANHVEEGSIGLQDLYDTALVSPIYVVFKVKQHVSSFFLHRLLKLDSYRQRFRTATTSSVDRRGSLRWPAFSKLTVELPPTEAEQMTIATVIADMERELAALVTRREKARDLKQAMMQELLSGKTRLIPAGVAHA